MLGKTDPNLKLTALRGATTTKGDTDFFIKVLEKNIGRRWNSFSVKILN